ncbi:MAG: signal peptidase I [Acidimicrobiales bacterium]
MTTIGLAIPITRRSSRTASKSLVRRGAVSLLTIALFFGAWILLAPPALGGRNTYVVTSGVSMLPHFHAGDLVILRKESTYRVGEVAAYQNHELGVVVMHRIIAIRDGHYVFKGDNNDFIDSYEPTKSQIVGAEWVHLSRVGRVLTGLRIPGVAAALLALLWILSLERTRVSRRRRRRHRHAS